MRIYIDASVFGGCYDKEYASRSKTFFDALTQGQGTALISDTLVAELVEAPERVQDLLERVMTSTFERLGLTDEAENLRDAYLAAGVRTPKWADDALHVAQATVARADVIVSWNFRHLVNPLRIRGFSEVNATQGYGPVVILTPEDVTSTLKELRKDEQGL